MRVLSCGVTVSNHLGELPSIEYMYGIFDSRVIIARRLERCQFLG